MPLPRGRRMVCLGALAASAIAPGTLASQVAQGSAATADPQVGAAVVDGRNLPVREHVLANGMHFLLLQRPGAPTVSFVVHVPVGSVHEPDGATGISHLLEHLLFKGTTTIGTRSIEGERRLFEMMDAAHDSLVLERAAVDAPNPARIDRLSERIEALEDSARAHIVPNEFDEILTANGARGLNATTSYESTQYMVSLPSNRAQLWFALEADRLRNPVFRDFYAEKNVVLEERRTRTDASPAGRLYAEHMAAAFPVHPYGIPPIGHTEDLLALSRAQVREHFRRFYGPGNMTVAIVGTFDADSVVAWADRYFGPLDGGEAVPAVAVEERLQDEERRVEVPFEAEPQIRIGWKIPADDHPDTPALAVLTNILVAGRDARLYRRLVREDRIATAVVAGAAPGGRYPGLFTIQSAPLAPHRPEEIEAAIEQELDRLRLEPPTAAELGRVRTRLAAASVRRLVSNEGLALQLASSQAKWGDWRETFRTQARMAEVQAGDIVDVVDRYLQPENATVAILRRAVSDAR